YADAHSNMGVALQDKGELDAAIDSFKQALKIKPDYAEAWNNITFPLQAIKSRVSSEEELVSYYPEDTGSNYYQIAKSILNFKIKLGGTDAEKSLSESLNALAKADYSVIKKPEHSKDSASSQMELTDEVIALVHFGRSGTGLLHSLIDGHLEVSTLPSIYLSQYFDSSTWERIICGGWSQMADQFMAMYDVIFDAMSTVPVQTQSNKLISNIGRKEGMANVGDQRDEVLSVDKTLFSAELQRLMNCYDQLDSFLFFKLIHRAYDKTINNAHQKNLIFYHIHNPDTYAKLNFVQSAPKANWVMMVREPVQSCESWLKKSSQQNKYFEFTQKIRSMLFEIDNIIYYQQNSVGVRLEDLKECPRQTIPALCNWMGIEETESLYEMTAQGKKWWGDPASPDFARDGMNAFGKTSINRKLGSVFSTNDQFILRTLFYPFSVRFGYVEENAEQFKIDLQTIRPMLDDMFDFERTIAEQTEVDPERFMKSGSYLNFRSGLIERWDILNEFQTYPNMIAPLRINRVGLFKS
ncbi:tetratricopeptide repeat protein, partial [Planktomarina temperata]|nr:tetratricopeptide repeat protein [Planktomarina temperata]